MIKRILITVLVITALTFSSCIKKESSGCFAKSQIFVRDTSGTLWELHIGTHAHAYLIEE